MRVVRVSGTIRKAEEEAMRRARESMRRAMAQEGGSAGCALAALMHEQTETAVTTRGRRGDGGDEDTDGGSIDDDEDGESEGNEHMA